jgi:uncharacterized protein (DUF1499 family)
MLVRAWPVINVVETGKTEEYPDVRPRVYQEGRARVFDAALHAVHRLPRWTLSSYVGENGSIRAEARTLVFRFVDDILIRVLPEGTGSRVEVRSASRVGRGDFGQNARNIRVFFQELDHQLAQSSEHE